jgi:hypothetical protein
VGTADGDRRGASWCDTSEPKKPMLKLRLRKTQDVMEKKISYRRERENVDEEDRLIFKSSKHWTWYIQCILEKPG